MKTNNDKGNLMKTNYDSIILRITQMALEENFKRDADLAVSLGAGFLGEDSVRVAFEEGIEKLASNLALCLALMRYINEKDL